MTSAHNFHEKRKAMTKAERIAYKHKTDIRERMPSHSLLKGKRCSHCGSADDLTWDHILPIAHGGTNPKHNLQPLCHDCNQKKAASLTRKQMERALA